MTECGSAAFPSCADNDPYRNKIATSLKTRRQDYAFNTTLLVSFSQDQPHMNYAPVNGLRMLAVETAILLTLTMLAWLLMRSTCVDKGDPAGSKRS